MKTPLIVRVSFVSAAQVALVATTAMLAFAGIANATLIAVDNPSFELPDIGLAASLNTGDNGLPGWTGSGSTENGVRTTGATPTDGDQMLYTSGSTRQVVQYPSSGPLYMPATIYTLEVDIGNVQAGNQGFTFALLGSGNTVLASNTGLTGPTTGTLQPYILSFDTALNPSAVGQPVGIMLLNGPVTQNVWDSVTLDAIPEPSTVMLFGLGGLLFWRRARGTR